MTEELEVEDRIQQPKTYPVQYPSYNEENKGQGEEKELFQVS